VVGEADFPGLRVLDEPSAALPPRREKFGWFGQKFHGLIKGTKIDPMYAWTQSREAPQLALHTFKDYWRRRQS